jgi:nuclear mRNA export protein PCID2/THP1
VVVKDRTPVTTGGSKKVALFAVTCVLFKIYFKVNTLQLCSKLINVIDVSAFRGGKLLHQECYPVSDVVMYFYYLGRLKLFEDKYEESRDCFMLSLRHLPGACLRNRQRIIVNLTAVNMVLGVMPTSVVAKTYGMTELYELSLAARRGDIASFDRLMGAHQQAFLRIGVYLLLEQVKVLSYRCLLKRLYLIGNANTRISLITVASIMNSLQGQGQSQNQGQGDADDLDTVDIDEVECIVANLIYAGKVKGYISHQKSFLVLSKQDPFPTQAVVTVKAAGGANSVFGFGAR